MSKKLEKLLLKEKQLKAQIQQAQAAKRTQERKRDTRRKILVGTAVLSQVEKGEFSQEDLTSLMDKFLTRPIERELFGLTIQSAQSTKESKTGMPLAEASSTTKRKQSSAAKTKSTRKRKRSSANKAKSTTKKTLA